MRRFLPCLLTLAALATPSGHASAGLVLSSNRAGFEGSTSDLLRVDFEGIADTGTSTETAPPAFTTADATFSSENINITSETYYQDYNLGSGDFLQAFSTTPNAPGSLLITLDGGFNAVGFDIATFDVGQSWLSIVVNEDVAGAFDVSAPYLTTTFVGITSTSGAISSILITVVEGDRGNLINLDGFVYGNILATPEPSTLVLAASGAAFACGLVWARRRKAAG